MAGQEGLEPPTGGFGDRCSTIGATDLKRKGKIPFAFLTLKLYLFMNSVFIQSRTKFFELQFFYICFSVFCGAIIYITTLNALQSNFYFHKAFPYSIIFVTTPAPTVLPPSRIANLVPSSRAIGLIRSTVILILSPGITISVPSGKAIEPVTSVVLT